MQYPTLGQCGMDHRAPGRTPFLGIPLAHHDHVHRDAQRPKLPPEPDLLGGAILDVSLHDQEVQIAVLRALSTSSRPEQDHPASRRGGPQNAPASLLYDGVVEHAPDSRPVERRRFVPATDTLWTFEPTAIWEHLMLES